MYWFGSMFADDPKKDMKFFQWARMAGGGRNAAGYYF
jgi:hypothetical protein